MPMPFSFNCNYM